MAAYGEVFMATVTDRSGPTDPAASATQWAPRGGRAGRGRSHRRRVHRHSRSDSDSSVPKTSNSSRPSERSWCLRQPPRTMRALAGANQSFEPEQSGAARSGAAAGAPHFS